MHINDLPSEIIRHIIQFRLESTYSHVSFRRDMLPLMAICRRWRLPSLWFVYRHVYLECMPASDIPLDRCACTPSKLPFIPHTEPTDRICSNLALVPSGFEGLPKEFTIIIKYSHSIVFTLSKIIDILNAHKDILQKVVHLTVDIGFTMSAGNQRIRDSTFHREKVNMLAIKFGQLVPNITSFKCVDIICEAAGLRFLQAFAKNYAHQLCKIISSSAVIGQTDTLSGNLSMLYLSCSPRSNVPRVFTDRLTRLVLSGVADSCIWKSFEDSNDVGRIYLPCLAHLDIGFKSKIHKEYVQPVGGNSAQDLSTGILFTLVVPNIKSLRINLFPHVLALLAAAELPEIIPKFTIRASSATHISFYNLRIDGRMMKVFERHAGMADSQTMIDHIGLASEILRTESAATRVHAVITDHLLSDVIKKMRWKSTTTLVLVSPISLSNLQIIITQLPFLVELEAHFITIDTEFTRLLSAGDLPASSPNTRRHTISTSLKYLLLGFEDGNVPEYLLERVNSYLRQAIEIPTKIDIF